MKHSPHHHPPRKKQKTWGIKRRILHGEVITNRVSDAILIELYMSGGYSSIWDLHFRESKTVHVEAYSNKEDTELFQNG